MSGERGIRTPGTLRYTGFRNRHNRPLCHLSWAMDLLVLNPLYIEIRAQRQIRGPFELSLLCSPSQRSSHEKCHNQHKLFSLLIMSFLYTHWLNRRKYQRFMASLLQSHPYRDMLLFIDVFCVDWFSLIFRIMNGHRKFQLISGHLA